MLPILHLNGYKIANPTVLARISHEELEQLFRGYGYTPYLVEGDDPEKMHQLMAATLDRVIAEIKQIQTAARARKRMGIRRRAATLAHDRVCARPRAGPARRKSTASESKGFLALAPGAHGRDGMKIRSM